MTLNRFRIIQQARAQMNIGDDVPLRVITDPVHPDGTVADWRGYSCLDMYSALKDEHDREALNALILCLGDPDRASESAEALVVCLAERLLDGYDLRRIENALAGVLGANSGTADEPYIALLIHKLNRALSESEDA